MTTEVLPQIRSPFFVSPKPKVTIQGDSTVCVGQNIQLSINGPPGSACLWTVTQALPLGYGPPVKTTFTGSSISFQAAKGVLLYSVDVVCTDVLTGCSSTATTLVAVNQSPAIFGPNAVCEGDLIRLTTLQWGQCTWTISDGNTTKSYTGSEVQFTAQPAATAAGYQVHLECSLGPCTQQADHLITVNPRPKVIIVGDQVVCRGDMVNLWALVTPGATVLWRVVEGSITTTHTGFGISFVANTAGPYVVEAEASLEDGMICQARDKMEIQVIDCPLPCPCELHPDFTFSADHCAVKFRGSINAGECQVSDWIWNFGDGTSGSGQMVNHVYPKGGIYKVCLTVVATSGNALCKEQICRDIRVPDCSPVVSDCNRNEIEDTLDIAKGLSRDCNGNGVPDECDIRNETSQDRNGNTIPDECELVDCNGNGLSDREDILTERSKDCNRNGVPDECDLARGTSISFLCKVNSHG